MHGLICQIHRHDLRQKHYRIKKYVGDCKIFSVRRTASSKKIKVVISQHLISFKHRFTDYNGYLLRAVNNFKFSFLLINRRL